MRRGTDGAPLPRWTQGTGREPSVHQLRLFCVLAEELHFSRAAARMFMTQPAFSQQIRALEKRLGVTLVDRSGHRPELTAAGRALLPTARTVVESMTELRQAADVHARQTQGRLVIGSIGAETQRPYARAVLEELRVRHPYLTLQVSSLDIASHVTALVNGDIDVSFLLLPMPPGVESVHLSTEPRVVCLPADDPLATRSSVTLAELEGRPMVDVPPDCPRVWWNFWVVDPRPDGTPVRYGPVVPEMEALILAVSRGEAIAFLPTAARAFYPRPGVQYVTVSDIPHCTSALSWLAENRDLPTIRAIRQAVDAVRRRTDSLPGHDG